MAKYNVNLDGVNMQHVTNFDVVGANDGSHVAYSPASFVDIYSYATSGRDGSSKDNAYNWASGTLTPSFTQTAKMGYPKFIPYRNKSNMLLSDIYVGCPMVMVQAVVYNNKLGFYGFRLANDSVIDITDGEIELVLRRDKIYGSPDTYPYWNGSDWQSSRYTFVQYLSYRNPIMIPFIQKNESYRYTLSAKSIINDVVSYETHVSFILSDDCIQIDDVANEAGGAWKKNMYNGRWFYVPNTAQSVAPANLPMVSD